MRSIIFADYMGTEKFSTGIERLTTLAKACTASANTQPCDDGSPCSIGDRCDSGACKPGKAAVCDDGNLCTDDACDPNKGGCVKLANAASCTDANACTVTAGSASICLYR